MVEVLEIEQDINHTGNMQGACIPLSGCFSDRESMRLKVQGGAGTVPYLKVSCCTSARRNKPIKIAPGVEVFSVDAWSSYH